MILVIEATVIFKKMWCSDRNIFRQDGQRTIADTLNVVPFGVRVGRSLVEIEDPREVACQSLRTVASEYKQKSLNVLEQIWGFLVGTRHRGIQSTEEMLLVGTKLTAIGSLAKGQHFL